MIQRPDYQYKTAPRGKQRDVIESTWSLGVHAFLCRPGTGKTKMGLDTAGLLYAADRIGAVIVVSLNSGVAQQWVDEGVRDHLATPAIARYYLSDFGIQKHQEVERALRSKDKKLRILSLSIDALQTERGLKLAHSLCTAYKTLLIMDESHNYANIKGTGFKALLKLAVKCRYKRIATGTLLRQNPYTAYGQFELLGHGLLGFETYSAFKSMYAQMLPKDNWLVQNVARTRLAKRPGVAPNKAAVDGQAKHIQIEARDASNRPIYRNLNHLGKKIMEYASFLTLADVNGVEPIVNLSTRFVVLTEEQRRMHDELKRYGVTLAAGNPHDHVLDETRNLLHQFRDPPYRTPPAVLTADLAITTGLRLSQICGGFVPNDDDPRAKPIFGGNPKLDELMLVVEELGPDETLVVWCRFTAEVEACVNGLETLGTTVKYSGAMTDKEKSESKRMFRDGEAQYFVGQVVAGGTGLDGLQTRASYMVFYSNDYSYTVRDQAIARLARTGGASTVNVIDLMAIDSADQDVVRCMQTAQDVHARALFSSVSMADPGVQSLVPVLTQASPSVLDPLGRRKATTPATE